MLSALSNNKFISGVSVRFGFRFFPRRLLCSSIVIALHLLCTHQRKHALSSRFVSLSLWLNLYGINLWIFRIAVQLFQCRLNSMEYLPAFIVWLHSMKWGKWKCAKWLCFYESYFYMATKWIANILNEWTSVEFEASYERCKYHGLSNFISLKWKIENIELLLLKTLDFLSLRIFRLVHFPRCLNVSRAEMHWRHSIMTYKFRGRKNRI